MKNVFKAPDPWTAWLWKIDQQSVYVVMDRSPKETMDDPRDWILAVGAMVAWWGPEELFLEAFKPFLVEPKVKYQNRPELVLKNSPKTKPIIKKKGKNKKKPEDLNSPGKN